MVEVQSPQPLFDCLILHSQLRWDQLYKETISRPFFVLFRFMHAAVSLKTMNEEHKITTSEKPENCSLLRTIIVSFSSREFNT
jgi:hypothetical protein